MTVYVLHIVLSLSNYESFGYRRYRFQITVCWYNIAILIRNEAYATALVQRGFRFMTIFLCRANSIHERNAVSHITQSVHCEQLINSFQLSCSIARTSLQAHPSKVLFKDHFRLRSSQMSSSVQVFIHLL